MGKSAQFNIDRAKIVPRLSEQGLVPLPDIRTSSDRFGQTLLKRDVALEQIDKLCEVCDRVQGEFVLLPLPVAIDD